MELNLAAVIIEGIDDFSEHRLNKKTDLKTLYSLSIMLDEGKTFEELSFTAKYAEGLMRVLKTGINNPVVKSLEHIKKDFTHNMQKIDRKSTRLNSSHLGISYAVFCLKI